MLMLIHSGKLPYLDLLNSNFNRIRQVLIMVTYTRKAVSGMELSQRMRIGEMIDKERNKDKHFKDLMSVLLDLVSTKEIWTSLENDNLLHNLSKLRMVKEAISKSKSLELYLNIQHLPQT